ncbi:MULTISPECIES: glutamate 5-kinase [Atopobiaceae]|uniref:Glutamate 5-kinase n=1 Tax=Parafannyhessea umbonata TaxID=604330 RepID=A0A1H9NU95_9ACTN|nr:MULTISPECIES: glutamate 5-kinase [Atopobiaceae]SEH57943.1 glutamate 5-kinase [Parafannyhessea umbonata]SER39468.1 glutamate 5-kinase [Parafannyhessea umbonata]SJZ51134.1 glutamate 5-kinase [Olsenella sp. KH1P3]
MEGVFDTPDVVVVKVGSSTLVDANNRPDRAFIETLCDQAAELQHDGYHVVIVSSGAVAAGMERLGLDCKPQDMPGRQACASAGQAALTEVYADLLGRHRIACGQVLLTRRDLTDREGYLNARNTLGRLIGLGAIPVINENDTVSFTEFNFGDNDTLGAIVSTMLNADLYVILSDIDGLYTANPQDDPNAELVPLVKEITPRIAAMAGGAGSSVGTGGMASKLRAARATLAAGIPMVICKGRERFSFERVVRGEALGTRFEAPSGTTHESARKLWIGLAEMPKGSLVLDAGASEAVVSRGASVLPVGVVGAEGVFEEGDVVNVIDDAGKLLGRGIVRYSSEDIGRVHGLKLDVIERFLPHKAGQPAIHRDELLVF